MNVRTTKTSYSHPTDQTGSKAPTTISRRSRLSSIRGFTLVEILIVLTVIALVMSVGLPAIDRVTYQQVNSTTRKLVGLMRTIRNDSILLNVVHRLVFDLDNQTWWVEGQRTLELISEGPPPVPKKGKKGDEPPPSNFLPVEKYSKEPKKLPGGVVVRGVLKEGFPRIVEGKAYIHFFPNGFAEQAIIYITKDGAESIAYSVIVRPNSGKIDVERSEVKEFTL